MKLRHATGHVSVLLLFGATAVGQTAQTTPVAPGGITWDFLISKNYLPYHQLKPEDFPVNDHPDLTFGFFGKSFIQPSFRYVVGTSPGGYVYIHITEWKIFAGLNKNESWRRSSVRDLKQALAYAQMGLDLNEIYARQLAAMRPGDLPWGEGATFDQAYAQLAGRITALVQSTLAHAENEREKLADETNQGQDQKKLQTAAAAIRKRLQALNTPTPSPASTIASSPVPVSSMPAKAPR